MVSSPSATSNDFLRAAAEDPDPSAETIRCSAPSSATGAIPVRALASSPRAVRPRISLRG